MSEPFGSDARGRPAPGGLRQSRMAVAVLFVLAGAVMGGWTGRKWKEKEIFVLFAGITLVMAVVSLLGVTGRYSF